MNKLQQECKDEVARKHGWLHFQELIDDKNFEGGFDIMNEAMQLYAKRYSDEVYQKDSLKETKTLRFMDKTASEKLLIVAKTIEAIRKGAQVEWPEGIEFEIRDIASQIELIRHIIEKLNGQQFPNNIC
jgi:hypothetical protein